MSADAEPILAVEAVEAVYGGVVLALRGVGLTVRAGGISALLGANGAGKSTTLKAISGLIRSERGRVTAGRIRWRGTDIVDADPSRLVAEGLVQVLEGRHVFPQLTVEQNLVSGAYVRGAASAEIAEDLERIYAWFPRLKVRRAAKAGYTSGGEQQMVAIGRALMTRPKLVLLDEPSMGLAPIIVEEIFEIVRQLNREAGVSFLLAEQNAHLALRYADHAHLLENGRVVAEGPAADLAGRDDVAASYLGGGEPAVRPRRRRPAPSIQPDIGP
ncbi:ABC transporter ATP-binding protein [Oharaeibacter diazotrophicus]|uniref:Amino acid/amide ABC transporter ATP-binding protein 2 (HAAT family) n=1 Tax=Oharaeibacter diazotrophicus TaxID=1920512 RepID=A0A4R6RHW4_9HYPH|nr:ABC transporter ATP-binding protein [Oharaeibacter diazotrophicus]TDP85266.1 amino acid/amide ABC transporter ATP-binding protein 2 (HAAT family) [Oharaeibacter diazotrophicus]BBE74237.1 high-affinity branched-chain amino acid transport ATP-binding protein LivF [Pleomorphomonas sp. SM30]GLS76074.1 ABC transporter ATP-binding protein [Oharaeibacter diazotrophicus]